MIEEEAARLREERRAKMKEIKDNLTNDLWNRDGVTSAPDVREVNEFHEELSAAERRKRTAEKMLAASTQVVEKGKIVLKSKGANDQVRNAKCLFID